MGNQWADRYGSVMGEIGGGQWVGLIVFPLTHFNALVASLPGIISPLLFGITGPALSG